MKVSQTLELVGYMGDLREGGGMKDEMEGGKKRGGRNKEQQSEVKGSNGLQVECVLRLTVSTVPSEASFSVSELSSASSSSSSSSSSSFPFFFLFFSFG